MSLVTGTPAACTADAASIAAATSTSSTCTSRAPCSASIGTSSGRSASRGSRSDSTIRVPVSTWTRMVAVCVGTSRSMMCAAPTPRRASASRNPPPFLVPPDHARVLRLEAERGAGGEGRGGLTAAAHALAAQADLGGNRQTRDGLGQQQHGVDRVGPDADHVRREPAHTGSIANGRSTAYRRPTTFL